jgi:hypothetical protein
MMFSRATSLIVLVALACLACSGPSDDTPQCLGALVTMTTSACTTCQQNSCGSELSSVESGCSAYLECICPNGTFTTSETESCETDISTASCSSAVQAMSQCVEKHCTSQC